MAQDEFSIIERFFGNLGPAHAGTQLGIGDDAAVVEVADGEQLVVSMDTLVGGVHFSEDTSPADVAYKALAVNVSDLAAMAARPAWFLLSLTLPQYDESWLTQFANALRQSADTFKLALIGGDTCRGPLALTIQVAGYVARGQYVRRGGAEDGDLVLVSGEIGNAALGLADHRGEIDLPPAFRGKCRLALNRPQPRLELQAFLREYAHAAIDISDGLAADLGHIVDASGRGAVILRDLLPVNEWLIAHQAWDYALHGGDDYEICCCVAPACKSDIEDWNHAHPDCKLSPIGEITGSGLWLHHGDNKIELDARGYRHFD